ncbi:MAG: hypothetical protein N3E50_07140 [Candidatus Goldbacteria bacterium]|nr:hypothetical protein [Candidatus Goldiibacteriota bacterium]
MEIIKNIKTHIKKINLLYKLCIFELFFIIIILIIRTAWICDDAYITFRVIDNFINGYGLRWNIVERVQVFTHPLWLFILSSFYFFTKNIFNVVYITSIILSALTLIILYKTSISFSNMIIIFLTILFSKPFIEYATSGLENPLLYFLVATFFFFYIKNKFSEKNLFILTFIASLATITRYDNILFYIPPITYYSYKIGFRNSFKYIICGLLPIFLWEVFSIIYYGFPFPNTYYAKTHHSIPLFIIMYSSGIYFTDIMIRSPITLITILITLLITFLYKKEIKYIFLSIGIIIYLFYIVTIGCDFMSGRLFTVPFLISICIISQNQIFDENKKLWLFSILFIISLGIFTRPCLPLFYNGYLNYIYPYKNIVADEITYYYEYSSLYKKIKNGFLPENKWAKEGKELRQKNEKFIFTPYGIGVYGYNAGPSVYIFDQMALADPLLSRLPAYIYSRIGHFKRIVPEGYLQTLNLGKNLIVDKNLAEFYDKLSIIIRGPIFSKQRFIEIIKMNLGFYNHLLKKYSATIKEILKY